MGGDEYVVWSGVEVERGGGGRGGGWRKGAAASLVPLDRGNRRTHRSSGTRGGGEYVVWSGVEVERGGGGRGGGGDRVEETRGGCSIPCSTRSMKQADTLDVSSITQYYLKCYSASTAVE